MRRYRPGPGGGVAWLMITSLAACAGRGGGEENTGAIPDNGTRGTPLIGLGEQSDCSSPMVGTAGVRRISRIEYDNTVAQLLGDDSQPAAGFVPETALAGFGSNVGTPVTDHNVTEYFSGAETIAQNLMPRLPQVTGCASASDTACFETWLTATARKVFHGTLPDDERAALIADYEATLQATDATSAASFAVESLLMSPRFLYVVELGRSKGGIVPLTASETAGRLALSLWRSAPDDELLAAADSGSLDTADGVAAQARRMLEDPRAVSMLDDFVTQWMEIPSADALAKNPTSFPLFTASVRSSIIQETRLTFRTVYADTSAGVDQLFTLPFTVANADVGSVYGMTGLSTSFTQVPLPAGRAGILTQPAVLAAHAHPAQPAPVLRGKLVRFNVLCDPVGDPPPNVQRNLADPMPGQTEQDVQNAHLTNDSCRGCHKRMDPIGFGFNRFDAAGQMLTDANITTAGNIDPPVLASVQDISGPFDGPAQLGQMLAASDQVKQCYLMQNLRYVMGREEQSGDACGAAQAWEQFKANGYTLKEALVAVVTSDVFRFRTTVNAGGSCQ